MGGQACILYGGTEFSRDTDLAVLAEPDNLRLLQAALGELQAEVVAVPQFEAKYLEMGLAVHFRCRHPDADKQRVDVMSKMRGVDAFPVLWSRRTTLASEDETVEVMALPDLIRAKKTQRDKDWPMIASILEVHYHRNRDEPAPARIEFWARELRTPSSLLQVALRFPADCARLVSVRPLLSAALAGDKAAVTSGLKAEEEAERAADRVYWAPLRKELERLRTQARKQSS